MSDSIENCPQPDEPMRDRAYTPEQLERHAKHCDAVEEHDAARMLRAYAATLRQQPTNQPEIGSKSVGQQGEQAGGVVTKQVLVAIERGEGYEDVHPELVAEDCMGNAAERGWRWRVVSASPAPDKEGFV